MAEALQSDPATLSVKSTLPSPPGDSRHEQGAAGSLTNRTGADMFLRLAELAVFLVAVVGAVSLGLGITDYFGEHAYIASYLIAYMGFRAADLLVRENYEPDPVRDALGRRVLNQLPILVLFAAAPFERTYLYGGEAPTWMGALGLLLELAGLWLALGARIQLGFFGWKKTAAEEERHVMVKSGFYRFIRHPTFTGVFIALLAWPVIYGAPISGVLTLIVGALVMRTAIADEEAELLSRFGDEYADYRKTTDAVIPSIW